MSEPVHIISLGAGVQSSTMALMAAKGEITPMPKCAIFADTQDEPQSVYTWLGWLEKQLPFPVHRVTAGSLSQHSLKMRTTRDGRAFTTTSIPYFTLSKSNQVGKITHRTCTADFKVKPLLKEARRIGAIKRSQKTVGVIQWIGISIDEISRCKESRDRWCECRWPLIEAGMNRHDCLRWMARLGYPPPPRSACVYCPYHSDAEWLRLKREEPTAFNRAIDFERAQQRIKGLTDNFNSQVFLHRSCRPLGEVDFSTEEERGQLNMFNNECEGMCGV